MLMSACTCNNRAHLSEDSAALHAVSCACVYHSTRLQGYCRCLWEIVVCELYCIYSYNTGIYDSLPLSAVLLVKIHNTVLPDMSSMQDKEILVHTNTHVHVHACGCSCMWLHVYMYMYMYMTSYINMCMRHLHAGTRTLILLLHVYLDVWYQIFVHSLQG